MNEKLLAGLNESRRDALVPYYLTHVIPQRGLGAVADRIKTAEDLYEYLLLDPKVSGQIKTSRIAEAVASAQLYLHRCRRTMPHRGRTSRPGATTSSASGTRRR